jgi:uncharacterized damage-inducible protein DinB
MFKNELESEALVTRKMLSRIPDDKYDWKPHAKSMSVRQLATHIAELTTWVGVAIHTDELDFAKSEYKQKQINNTEELMQYFEECLAGARKELESVNEDILDKRWVLRSGDSIFLDITKAGMIQAAFKQIIHHRAQLGVFLRLLDVPIPGTYGPSADDMNF